MPSFTSTLFAAAALLSVVSASPITVVKRDTCGTAPSGTTSQTPLAQPTGITTAEACQSQCEAESGCESFMFGMVDNVDTCILYSVPASDLPAQTNLVAYDVACSDVPAVVPTTSNPTGVETSSSSTGSSTGSTTGNTGSTGSTGSAGSTTSSTGTGSSQSGAHKRDTCGSAPSGPTNSNTQPIATPSGITSAADCEAQCKANTNCESYTFGDNTCKLFNVAAADVPAGAGAAVYDVGC